MLLESGPGHVTRCTDAPFYQTFAEAKKALRAAGKTSEEIREALEDLNLGRLRIASKGISRDPDAPAEQPRYIRLAPEQQKLEGMYMIGQLAALRAKVCTMRELHEEVSSGAAKMLRSLETGEVNPSAAVEGGSKPSAVAIIGMACLFPGAKDLKSFWNNILNKVDAIREIPADRFDPSVYFDADKNSRDKMYSRWGGFLDDIEFDPMRYGIPPAALPSIDPFQLLSLEVTYRALQDADYLNRDFPRQRTSAIFGMSGGLGDVGLKYGVRSLLTDVFRTNTSGHCGSVT